MKTDSIFYRLFQEFPGILFEILGNSAELAKFYEFSSIEIKQTAFRIDGVFLPSQTGDHPVYFVEVQFQADEEFYSRLFAEVFLYLRQNQPQNDWGAVVLYPSRNVDSGNIKHYREFFASQRVRCIYLDELGEAASLPITLATVKLVIAAENTAIAQATQLIARTRQEVISQPQQQQLLQLIETILIYKFPNMSREEIEAMFGLSELKQTRVYQEAFEEGREEGERRGKLKAVQPMLAAGLSIEQIAVALDLSLDEVRQALQPPPNSEGGN